METIRVTIEGTTPLLMNKPEEWTEPQLKKLRANEPEMVTGFFGSQRLKKKERKAVTP